MPVIYRYAQWLHDEAINYGDQNRQHDEHLQQAHVPTQAEGPIEQRAAQHKRKNNHTHRGQPFEEQVAAQLAAEPPKSGQYGLGKAFSDRFTRHL